jgi:DNA-binding transcriptional LysR family regulator
VPRPTEIRFYDHHFLIVEAASAGLGVVLSPMVLATDDIDRERLIAPVGFDPDGATTGSYGQDKLNCLGKLTILLARWLEAECKISFG